MFHNQTNRPFTCNTVFVIVLLLGFEYFFLCVLVAVKHSTRDFVCCCVCFVHTLLYVMRGNALMWECDFHDITLTLDSMEPR